MEKPSTTKEELEWLAKVVYFKHNMDAVKADPKYWESLSHEKQVELHQIKKDLDTHFMMDSYFSKGKN